jgi:hypothetical protein
MESVDDNSDNQQKIPISSQIWDHFARKVSHIQKYTVWSLWVGNITYTFVPHLFIGTNRGTEQLPEVAIYFFKHNSFNKEWMSAQNSEILPP